MRFLIKLVLAAVTFTVVAVALIIVLIPTEAVRDQVIALVEQETGRKVTVDGDTSFSLYPSIGVTMGGVTVATAPGMDGGPLLRAQSLNVKLKLMPLLQRDVQVEEFVMVRPVFDLRIGRDGRPNWVFEAPRAAAASDGAPPDRAGSALPVLAQTSGSPDATGRAALRDLSLGDVRIEDGTVVFTDERSGLEERVEAVTVALALPRLTDPLAAQGNLSWRGERVAFKGRVVALPALLDGGSSPVELSLDARLLKGTFNGTVAAGDGARAEGDLTVETPSVRAAAGWAGHPLPPGGGFGPAAFDGRIKAGGEALSLASARLALDGMTGRGEASVQFAGARPSLRAALTLDRLDLNPYLAADQGRSRESTAPARTAPPAPAPGEPAARPRRDQSLTDFIEELNQAPVPAVRGWSQRAFDLAALHALDADVKLTAEQILYQRIKLGRSVAAVTLRQGVLTADLSDFRAYGGVGSGRLTLDGARPVPALAARFDVDAVNALPLLTDAMSFDWISGKAKLAVTVSGHGRSESELIAALRGNGSVVFTDGAVEGINIPQMMRAIQAGQFRDWRRQEALKTDFSHLSGTFRIDDGVVQNKDLEMVGPLVRVTGDGVVDLPRERIDYRLLPRLVASLEGQGGSSDLAGLVVPVRLQGPLSDPKLRPDLERLMQDPDLAKGAIEQVGRAVDKLSKGDGRKVEQMLQNFLGGARQPDGQAQPDGAAGDGQPPQQVNPADALRQLFGR